MNEKCFVLIIHSTSLLVTIFKGETNVYYKSVREF
jgi:hypothetical protein